MSLGGLKMASSEEAGPANFESVEAAARARLADELDDGGFIAAIVRFPIVRQTPLPNREWFDDWVREQGPMSEVVAAFQKGLISADLYDSSIRAMAAAGHDA